MSVAFCLLALSGQFEIKYLLYIFAVLWALGEAMSAGTVEALMYETSQNLGYTDKFDLIYSKSMIFSQAGCAFGAFCAMTITYFLPLQYVAWLSVFPSSMQLIISYFFIEPDIKKKSTCISAKDILPVLKQFKNNKRLLFYSVADIYFSALGDISHRLESAYFKLFTSDWVINFIRMLKHFCGMAGFLFVPYLRQFSKAKVFFGSIICNVFVRTIALIFNNICTPFIHSFINFFLCNGLNGANRHFAVKRGSESMTQFMKGCPAKRLLVTIVSVAACSMSARWHFRFQWRKLHSNHQKCWLLSFWMQKKQ